MNGHVIYFSPTGTTKRIVRTIAGIVTDNKMEYDITSPDDNINLTFSSNDFVIIGIPVYSGRVPRLAKNTILNMRGSDTPAVLTVIVNQLNMKHDYFSFRA